MSAATKTVRGAVDTWLDRLKPSKNRPQSAVLRLKSGDALALVYLANPVPRGATVTSAVLRLYTAGSFGGGSPTVEVRRIAQRYVNSKTSWNDDPGATGVTASLTKASTGDGDEWAINVAPILQAVADGAAWYGFRITSPATTAREFRSQQAKSKPPTLTVSWTEPPATPTTLTPSAGQAVNASKPVVEADFSDTSGSTTLNSLQVQVSASSAMTSPWDSGEVLTTGSKARLDLNTTTYPGLAEGGVAYWRIRVKDSSGVWSAWSAVTSWTRTAKGTVTINSPASASPTLADFTPPVTWATSKVSEKWQVIVTRTDAGAIVFDSGERPGNGTQVTVEALDGEAVLTTGVPYVVEVRAWDSVDRIGTTDDPAYASATRAFTVAPGATTGVTGLRFETASPLPGLVVVFERASAPDGFTITRNGNPVATNLEPSAFAVTGTTYRYTLTNVRPNVDNVIGVSAIVNGVASPISTATGKARVSGVWLVEKDGSASVLLAQTGGSKFEQTEDGETLVPLGATEGVRITQGLRGYEGTVTGTLGNFGGKTRDEWVDAFLKMREDTGRVRRLVVGTEVFDVVTWNMSVRPTGDSAPGLRPVSFDFMQVGNRRKVS